MCIQTDHTHSILGSSHCLTSMSLGPPPSTTCAATASCTTALCLPLELKRHSLHQLTPHAPVLTRWSAFDTVPTCMSVHVLFQAITSRQHELLRRWRRLDPRLPCRFVCVTRLSPHTPYHFQLCMHGLAILTLLVHAHVLRLPFVCLFVQLTRCTVLMLPCSNRLCWLGRVSHCRTCSTHTSASHQSPCTARWYRRPMVMHATSHASW